ncbi:MAG: hypothetical protein ACYC4U_15570 [Pirellulaceae bacterium]
MVCNDVGPHWAPDGRRIGFLSDRHGSYRLCVMGGDGQHVQVFDATDPFDSPRRAGMTWDWSPDGRAMAFVNRDNTAIRSVDVATGEVRTLLDGPVAEEFSSHWSISWADQHTIVFSSAPLDEFLTHELFVLNPITGETRRVTFETDQGRNLFAPCVSPGGRQVVALRQSMYRAPENFLRVLNADYGQTDQIPVPGNPLLPGVSWSSDARHLLYAAGPEGAADIYRLELPLGTTLPLIISTDDDIEPDLYGSFEGN